MNDILTIFFLIKASLFIAHIFITIILRSNFKIAHKREIQRALTMSLVFLIFLSCVSTGWMIETFSILDADGNALIKPTSNDWFSYYPSNGVRVLTISYLLLSYRTLSFKKAKNNEIEGAHPLYFRLNVSTSLVCSLNELTHILFLQHPNMLLFTVAIILEVLTFIVLYAATGNLDIEKIKSKSRYFYSSIFTYFLFIIALGNLIIVEGAYPIATILASFAFFLKIYTVPFASTVKALYTTLRVETLGYLSILNVFATWLFYIYLTMIDFYDINIRCDYALSRFFFIIGILTLIYFFTQLPRIKNLSDIAALSSILNGAALLILVALSSDLSWFGPYFSYLVVYNIFFFFLLVIITLSMGYQINNNNYSPTLSHIRDHFNSQYPSFRILVAMVLALLFLLPPLLLMKTDFMATVVLHLLDTLICTDRPFDTFLLVGRLFITILLTVSNAFLYAKLIKALAHNGLADVREFFKKRNEKFEREQTKRDQLQAEQQKKRRKEAKHKGFE